MFHTIPATGNLSGEPLVNNMAAGNLVLSAAILFSGTTFNQFSKLSSIANLQIFSHSKFYLIQDRYLFPVVTDTWEAHQEAALVCAEEQTLWLSGDGRCDSPGHSAKYCTYSLMDQNSGNILDFQLVQVSEVENSGRMEKVGFERAMSRLEESGLQCRVLTTDRHPQIVSLMKKVNPHINHQFDVWHLAKNISKKLREKAKKKTCSELMEWINSVTNHLWWSAATCDKILRFFEKSGHP